MRNNSRKKEKRWTEQSGHFLVGERYQTQWSFNKINFYKESWTSKSMTEKNIINQGEKKNKTKSAED